MRSHHTEASAHALDSTNADTEADTNAVSSTFAALACSDGAYVCRRPECFRKRFDRDGRLKVVRYVKAEEIPGQLCAACHEELAPALSFLKPWTSTIVGRKPGLR